MKLKRMAEALASATAVSARAAGISERFNDDSADSSGKPGRVLIG
jgi:hypothetical protein